ncbi:MAG: asparaginase [candidate division Zixibacteria bacterium]|nr:asparaginase [candidate division Zixibacteria bacterium]
MNNAAVRAYRGDIVEAIYRAHIAVVDTQGRLLYSLGDPSYLTYWRSSSKPLQALPLVESGAADAFGLSEPELAVSCASHNAEDFHTDAVRSILGKAGLTEEDLQCGTHEVDRSFTRQTLAADQEPTRVYSNCSGKHSGMLAGSRHLGWPTATYRDPAHPLQQKILKNLSELSGCPVSEIRIGVDGCGVPVFAKPIRGMARAFALLAQPDGLSDSRSEALTRLGNAMMRHPHMVAGTRRFDTDLMREAGGSVVCKSGAAALQCVGLPGRGIGIAVKIENADYTYAPAVTMAVLRKLDVLSGTALKNLESYAGFPEVLNTRGETVGRIEVDFALEKVG